MPKVLGEAVGLSPLLVLVSVTTVGILFSGWAVLFAVPIAAVVVTLFDVVLRDVDPAEEEVPAVIFSPRSRKRRRFPDGVTVRRPRPQARRRRDRRLGDRRLRRRDRARVAGERHVEGRRRRAALHLPLVAARPASPATSGSSSTGSRRGRSRSSPASFQAVDRGRRSRSPIRSPAILALDDRARSRRRGLAGVPSSRWSRCSPARARSAARTASSSRCGASASWSGRLIGGALAGRRGNAFRAPRRRRDLPRDRGRARSRCPSGGASSSAASEAPRARDGITLLFARARRSRSRSARARSRSSSCRRRSRATSPTRRTRSA